ncbi:MAG: hypothetical protein R3E95_16280 [Thiolinea sp.]
MPANPAVDSPAPPGRQSLSRRFILFLFSVLGLASLSFLLVFYFFYQQQLAEERAQASRSVSFLLKSSLEQAMLRRDLHSLRDIVNELGAQQDIAEVMISTRPVKCALPHIRNDCNSRRLP